MKRTYIVKDGVTIEVRHNPLSGRYSVWENDESFRRVESKLFRKDINGESVIVRIDGNIFKGVSVRSCGTDFVFTEPCGWYTIALAIVPFVLSMVLSSIAALANAGFFLLAEPSEAPSLADWACLVFAFPPQRQNGGNAF